MIATRPQPDTDRRITDPKSHSSHYRHRIEFLRARCDDQRGSPRIHRRFDVWTFARLAPVSVASVAAIALIAPVVVAPPASAAPCAQAASAAPANSGPALPGAALPPVEHVPTGRMPRGAHNQAMPGLGPLPAAGLDPTAPGALNFAPLQQQGAVLPVPVPGPLGAAAQPVPNPTSMTNPGPNPAAGTGPTTGGPAAAIAGPTTTIVNWVNGPSSPNNTYTRFAISGADLGIMWDNGQTGLNDQVLMAFGDTFGDCSVSGQQWRSNTLFRSADRNLSDGMSVPDPAYGNVYAGSPVASATPPGGTSHDRSSPVSISPQPK